MPDLALSPAVPATSLSLGSRAQPCVAASRRGPSCPPARVPSPLLSAGTAPCSLLPFITLGVLLRILRWKHLNPVPSHPSAVPPPPPLQMGPTCKMWQDEPAWPAKNAPGSCPGAERYCRWRSCAGHGNRRLPPAWKHRRPPRRRVGLGHQMRGVLGQAGSGGWGLGRGMVWSGPSLVVLLWPQ